MLHARCDAAIDRVLTIEKVIVGKVDEKLAVGRIWVLRPGRTDGAAVMGQFGKLSPQIRQL